MSETDEMDGVLSGGMPDADDVLFPPVIPTASFPTLKSGVTGTVLAKQAAVQTEMGTGKPLFWDDGRPRMQVIVTLQTDQRDPDVEDDDGRRRLFVKADIMRAVRDAVKLAGRKQLEVGGELSVTWVNEGPAPAKGLSKPKLYEAKYLPFEEPFE